MTPIFNFAHAANNKSFYIEIDDDANGNYAYAGLYPNNQFYIDIRVPNANDDIAIYWVGDTEKVVAIYKGSYKNVRVAGGSAYASKKDAAVALNLIIYS